MKPLRVSEALNKTSQKDEAYPPDYLIKSICQACNVEKSLSFATVTTEGTDTLYRCGQCDDLFIVVCAWPSKKWQGRGYRFGDLSIHNKCSLIVPVGRGELEFPGQDDACEPTIG